MASPEPEEITLKILHEDLKTGFADLKTTLIAGFRTLPSRESGEEMVRLLREGNRLQKERLTQLDARIREQHLELQQALRGIADGVHALLQGQQQLHEDIGALIARLDGLIKGRGDGSPAV